MSERVKRMSLVLKLARQQEDELRDQLLGQEEQLKSQEAQLSSMERYNQDFQQELRLQHHPASGEQLSRQRHFLGELARAMGAQENQIKQQQQRLESLRGAWYQLHQKNQLIEELCNKIRHEVDIQAEKQLQKMLDDLVNRQSLQR